jgi:hopanoid C-3 methylase
MKILLINPPRSPYNSIIKYAPEEAKKYIHKKLIGPPLGLLTIAAAVKDYDVTLFDMKGEYDLPVDTPPLKELTQKLLKEHNPDIVGVTFIASEFNHGIEIFREVKKFNKNILTVAGGLHATICLEDFTDESIDVICPGQSACQFRELVKAKEQNKNITEVEGIVINQKNGKLKPTKKYSKIIEPAGKDFILPDRSHLTRWLSTYKVGKNPFPTTYIYSSLGCPYKCTFCSIWPQFCGHYHQRDVESVVSELKAAVDYPVVRFADANTIVNVDFIEKLFDRIEEEGIKKEYVMDVRMDTAVLYPKLIEKLAKNGLKIVICGFESFREEELIKYNKATSASLIKDAIDIFHKNGVDLRGNYVIPCDYDLDDFKAMKDYASGHKVTYAGYTILSPMPGTVFYNEIKDQIVDHDLAKYNFFNAVLKTTLPAERFYEEVGKLWLIKEGEEII